MITTLAHDLLPASSTLPSDRQRLFVLFFTGTLVDLVILGLFASYTSKVYVDSFITTLAAAVVLQTFLKLTIVAGRRLAAGLEERSGLGWTSLKLLLAWMLLFGSKFVILEALSFLLGNRLRIEGALNGAVWLTVVVAVMVIVEESIARFYRKLR